jgi:hypothetical protein
VIEQVIAMATAMEMSVADLAAGSSPLLAPRGTQLLAAHGGKSKIVPMPLYGHSGLCTV